MTKRKYARGQQNVGSLTKATRSHTAKGEEEKLSSILGRFYSVQYKSIFGAPDKDRRNTCEEARPSKLDFQRDEVVLEIKTFHIIASTQD